MHDSERMHDERMHDIDEPFQRISVDEAKVMIERGDVQLVDVRQPYEYALGHLHGADPIPLDTLLGRSSELREDKDIIFICAVGERSAVAAEMAATLGRTSIFNMEGGVVAWTKRGYPLE